MPHALVRTARDEHLWNKAKQIVQDEYSLSERDGDRYWRLVMGIFLRMKRLRKNLRPQFRAGDRVHVLQGGRRLRGIVMRVQWRPGGWWYLCRLPRQPGLPEATEDWVRESCLRLADGGRPLFAKGQRVRVRIGGRVEQVRHNGRQWLYEIRVNGGRKLTVPERHLKRR